MFKQIKISTKNYILSCISVLLLTGIWFFLNWNIDNVQNSWNHYKKEVVKRQSLLLIIKSDFGYGGFIHNFKNYVLRGHEKYINRFNKNKINLQAGIKKYYNLKDISDKEKTALKKIEQVADQYIINITKVKELISKGKTSNEIDKIVKIDDKPAFEAYFTLKSKYDSLSQADNDELVGILDDLPYYLLFSFLFLIVFITLFNLISSRVIMKQLGDEPNTIKDIAEKIAEGDLNIQLQTNRKQVIGVYAAMNKMVNNLNTLSLIAEDIANGNLSGHSLNGNDTGIFLVMKKMVDNLTRMLREIVEVTSTLSASSEELNATADALAEGAQNQAATVEESTATTEELAASIKEVSDNASMMKERINGSLKEAKEFKSSMEHVSEEMLNMSDMAERIGEIVKVITDIADQTKLLSLNAAIEAARAGEHGRGFAVVAEAISSLANSTAESTKDIRELIKDSIRQIHESVDQVKKSTDSFDTIVNTIENNNRVAGEISRAMEDQYQSSEQIQTTTEGINQLTQTVSASAEEMSASTNELRILSERLNTVVNAFNINGTGGSKGLALPDPNTK